ncbi:hypothetical protein KY285_023313 [Solanum tuberosum]|nr:hypothetical protein KY289_023648 [Solanum tuberosum]KAH0675512.1 hypothetical protein KY285_023313 [Solanum tuberosum]
MLMDHRCRYHYRDPTKSPPLLPPDPVLNPQAFPPLPTADNAELGKTHPHNNSTITTVLAPIAESSTNFTKLLAGSNHGGGITRVKLPHRPYAIISGKPTVSFTQEEDDQLAATCRLTIIGSFPELDLL